MRPFEGLVKKFFLVAFQLLFIPLFLRAEICEVTRFEELLNHVDEETVVFIDMDNTLTDSALSLGSTAWRHFLRKHFKGQKDPATQIDLHDRYTYLVAKGVPVRPVEETTPDVVRLLQEKKIVALCLTARGKTQWYTSTIDDVEVLTQQQLLSIGVDFRRSSIPTVFSENEIPSYSNGILFAAEKPKGEFLKELFFQLGYFPKKVILIDDKREQLVSVEAALQEFGIPFLGLWYLAGDQQSQDFDLHVTNVQLEALLQKEPLLSDEEAKKVISPLSPEAHLKNLLGIK